jgi:hypothetical protein
MDEDVVELFAEAIREGRPVVLFAGQSFGTAESGNDPILDALLDRLGREDRSSGWRGALVGGMADADMEWLAERFDRSVPSEAALRAFDVGWSGVFTSSIDPQFARRFATRGRQPESVLSRSTYARVSRSRSRPPIYYLLGKSDGTIPDVRAPRTTVDLSRRIAAHATEFLNRVAETATTRGVVVMAGYDPRLDWLPLDAVLAPLSERGGPRVLWFGTADEQSSEIADDMISRGLLVSTPMTLASSISKLEFEGRIDVIGSAAPDEPGMVSVTQGVLDITPALRLRVEASAAIVDDQWTEEPEPLDGLALHEAFRRFHGDLGGFRMLVEGVARGFAIKRDFEADLWKTFGAVLRRPQSDRVIIVHGQSGTGKSVAVARLTVEIRRQLKLPVVVATNRIPNYADIEAFCSEAERAGAPITVLICDASQTPHRYWDLASALQSMGRRLVVVGTSYRIDERLRDGLSQFVEAPAQISGAESSALAEVVLRFGHAGSLAASPTEGSSILAMLYRTISAGRERITAGVSGEARAVESVVRDRARRAPAPPGRSALADQLIAAGIADPSLALFKDDERLATLGQDAAGQLIDYVMAAGRLNCPVPLNLVMRALGQSAHPINLDQIAHLFADLDLFRWRATDAEGSDLLISPRLQLEAELICRRRLGDRMREIERLIELIRCVRPTGVDRTAERYFLLDLLQKLDREGPRGNEYRSGYLAFADALQGLREKNGVVDAALMLRECVFRRQAVWSLDGRDPVEERTEDERLAILNTARTTVEKALQLIDAGDLRASKRTKLNLTAERASIYGYLAVQRGRSDDNEAMWSDYLAAKTASARAVALSDDYHAIDIALWTSSDVLKGAKLSDERRAEVLADLYAALDLADSSMLTANQQVRYYERRARVAAVIKDRDLSIEALAKLESAAPAAATFLIATRQAEPIDTVEPPFDERTRELAGATADFLSARAAGGFGDDPRCQRLLVRLRWAHATGERILRGERGRTPARSDSILELLSTVCRLNERLGPAARNQERFLEAVLFWLAKDVSRAIEIWRSLSRDTEYEDRSRVIRRLLMTREDGLPIRFRGRVEGLKGTDDWLVRVEGLNATVPLHAHEFRNEDLAQGRELRDFGIAFNYVGPIADPLVRPVSRR